MNHCHPMTDLTSSFSSVTPLGVRQQKRSVDAFRPSFMFVNYLPRPLPLLQTLTSGRCPFYTRKVKCATTTTHKKERCVTLKMLLSQQAPSSHCNLVKPKLYAKTVHISLNLSHIRSHEFLFCHSRHVHGVLRHFVGTKVSSDYPEQGWRLVTR